MLNLQGGYNLVQSDRASVDVILGARYLDLALDFNLGLAAGQYAVARDIAASQVVWDGILGVQGRFRTWTIAGPCPSISMWVPASPT